MKKTLGMLALSLACASGVATAHEAGDWVVRLGATNVEPRESSDALALNNTTLVLGGKTSALGADSSTQLGATVEYMLTNSWGVELLAATPFHHDVYGTGALAGLKIASVRHLPPTLSLVYHFPQLGKVQFYAAGGLNFTTFFKEEITAAATTTLAGLGLRGGDLSLDNSTGLSVQGGVDYHFANNMQLNASLRWIDIDTTATIGFTGGSRLATDIAVDPLVYTLAVGFTF